MQLTSSSPVEVETLDGTREEVALFRLSLRQLYEFVEIHAGKSTPGLVAAACRKSIDWVNTLTDESFARLNVRITAENAREVELPQAMKGQRRRRKQSSDKWHEWKRLIARACLLGIQGGDSERVLDLTPGQLIALLEESHRLDAERQRATAAAFAAGFAGGDGYKDLVSRLTAIINS